MKINKLAIRERLLNEYQLGHSVSEDWRNVCTSLGYEAIKSTCVKK